MEFYFKLHVIKFTYKYLKVYTVEWEVTSRIIQ